MQQGVGHSNGNTEAFIRDSPKEMANGSQEDGELAGDGA